MGAHAHIFKPDSAKHESADKYIHITNSLFVGKSKSFDCKNIGRPPEAALNDAETSNPKNVKGNYLETTYHVAVSTPIFSAAGNKAPAKWVYKPRDNPSLQGEQLIKGGLAIYIWKFSFFEIC